MARRSRIKIRSLTASLVAILGLSQAPVVHAQFFGGIVYDPTNHVQNFQTAVHNYGQLIRQAQQLRNEANMLINQAKHLAKLDVNSAYDLNRILGEIAYLNRQAENVAYDVHRTRDLLREHFPENMEGSSEEELIEQAEEQFRMSRNAHHEAMVMQSKMVESIEEDQATITQLMNASHGAVGELQATQSTNQLLGLLIKQSMQSQQLQVAQARAESLESALDMAKREEARVRHKAFMGPRSAYGGGGN